MNNTTDRASRIAAFEDAGATVVSLARMGGGCPDVLIGYRGRLALCETRPDAPLSDERLAWYGSWRGPAVTVLHSTEDVVRVLEALTVDPKDA